MRILFAIGAGMMGVGLAGKSLLNIARIIKSKKSVIKSGKVGLYYKGGFDAHMTKREAYLILGVRTTATGSEIRERHKKLMMLNHPDSGGSTYVATKINQAKEMVIMDAPEFKI